MNENKKQKQEIHRQVGKKLRQIADVLDRQLGPKTFLMDPFWGQLGRQFSQLGGQLREDWREQLP